jgi:acyl-coenzyme A thioesterase PaaI-like protein
MSERPALPEGSEEIETVGFNNFVGPFYRLPDPEEGRARQFALVVGEKHMNASGTVHGGMLMTLADMSMGHTARLETGARGGSTVSLNCDFVGPGRLHDVIVSRVRVTRRARTMVFLTAELFAGDRPILVATGLWKLLGAA